MIDYIFIFHEAELLAADAFRESADAVESDELLISALHYTMLVSPRAYSFR